LETELEEVQFQIDLCHQGIRIHNAHSSSVVLIHSAREQSDLTYSEVQGRGPLDTAQNAAILAYRHGDFTNSRKSNWSSISCSADGLYSCRTQLHTSVILDASPIKAETSILCSCSMWLSTEPSSILWRSIRGLCLPSSRISMPRIIPGQATFIWTCTDVT
jgi:hypothetical protein